MPSIGGNDLWDNEFSPRPQNAKYFVMDPIGGLWASHDYANPSVPYSGAAGPFSPVRSDASKAKQIAFARELLAGHQARIRKIEDTLMNLPEPFSKKARQGYSDWFANRQLMQLGRRQEEAFRNGMYFDTQQQGEQGVLAQRRFDSTLAEQARAARLPSLLEKAGVVVDLGGTSLDQAGQTAQVTAGAPVPSAQPSGLEQTMSLISGLLNVGSKASSLSSNDNSFKMTR